MWNPRVNIQKTQGFKEQRSFGLRRKPGGRPEDVERIRHDARAELDLVVVEVGCPVEANIRDRIIELIASTVDPKVVKMLETFGMGQQQDANRKRAETELVVLEEDLASPTDGASPMKKTELDRDDQDIRITLLLDHLVPLFGSALGFAQGLRVDLTFTEVVDLELAEYDQESIAVSLAEEFGALLPIWNGDELLGVPRQLHRPGLDPGQIFRIGVTKARELHLENSDLTTEILDAGCIPGQVAHT